MKKSQRARLAVLTAHTARNEAEAAEFISLTAIASQHPDASKDTDDAAPAPVPAKASTLAELITAGIASMRGKAAVGADLAQARAQVSDLTAKLAASEQSLVEANQAKATIHSQLSTLSSQLASFASFFGIEASAIAGKTSAEAVALLTAKVNALVSDQVSALGFPAEKLPAAKSGDAPVEPAKGGTLTYAEFSALKPHEKMNFSCAGGRIDG